MSMIFVLVIKLLVLLQLWILSRKYLHYKYGYDTERPKSNTHWNANLTSQKETYFSKHFAELIDILFFLLYSHPYHSCQQSLLLFQLFSYLRLCLVPNEWAKVLRTGTALISPYFPKVLAGISVLKITDFLSLRLSKLVFWWLKWHTIHFTYSYVLYLSLILL